MQTFTTQQKTYLIESLRRTDPRMFFALVHHRNTGGRKMRFEGKHYLFPIYADNSRDIVIMKSVQCGISEWEILDTIVNCENGLSVFYVLPKYELRNTFVANRVNKLFNMVPYYRQRLKDSVGDADSAHIKHYANGTIKFVSSNTISDFLEFPADAVIVDELDRCDQKNIPYAYDRLKASTYKLTRKVGNPTISGFGIHDEFKNSDQKEWVVRCEHCNEHQELDFFKTVVEEYEQGMYRLRDSEWAEESGRDINTICAHCGKPFNRLSAHGFWLRKNPSSDVSGYHISRMLDGNTTIAELWKAFQRAQGNETKKQAFFNSDLGIPFESKGAKLSDFLLDQCVGDYSTKSNGVDTIMGVDVGSVLHVSVSEIENGKRKKIFIGTIPTFEELDIVIRQYGVTCGVVDALPETHEAKKLRNRFKGLIWLCDFHSKEGSSKELKLDHEFYKVSCDRTTVFDDSHADVLLKNVMFPINAKSIDEGKFYQQMCAPTRLFDEEANRFVWREGNTPDHYRLADVYEKIAATIKQLTGVRAWTL